MKGGTAEKRGAHLIRRGDDFHKVLVHGTASVCAFVDTVKRPNYVHVWKVQVVPKLQRVNLEGTCNFFRVSSPLREGEETQGRGGERERERESKRMKARKTV